LGQCRCEKQLSCGGKFCTGLGVHVGLKLHYNNINVADVQKCHTNTWRYAHPLQRTYPCKHSVRRRRRHKFETRSTRRGAAAAQESRGKNIITQYCKKHCSPRRSENGGWRGGGPRLRDVQLVWAEVIVRKIVVSWRVYYNIVITISLLCCVPIKHNGWAAVPYRIHIIQVAVARRHDDRILYHAIFFFFPFFVFRPSLRPCAVRERLYNNITGTYAETYYDYLLSPDNDNVTVYRATKYVLVLLLCRADQTRVRTTVRFTW